MIMTIDEIKKSEKTMLTVTDICRVVGLRADKIRAQAIKDSKKLGFPVCIVDRSVRIPRGAFLAWINGIPDKNPLDK